MKQLKSEDLQWRGSIEPLLSSGESRRTSVSTTSWPSPGATVNRGLLPALLVLSSEIERCDISVLDISAWSSNAAWHSCTLHESTSLSASPIPSNETGYAAAPASASGLETTIVPDYIKHSRQASVSVSKISGSCIAAACGAKGPSVQPSEACGALRLSSAPNGYADHLHSATSPAFQLVRNVTVARVDSYARGGPESPAGNSSTSSHTSGAVFRSCLRPAPTWTMDAVVASASGLQGEGEAARPIKSVRWLDDVARQVVAELQTAATAENDPLHATPGQPDDDKHPAIWLHPGVDDNMNTPTADLEEGMYSASPTMQAASSPGLMCPPSPQDDLRRWGSTLITPQRAACMHPRDQVLELREMDARAQQRCNSTGTAVPLQSPLQPPLELKRYLSPQMLRALERSQPISDVRTFTRSDSTEPTIIHVQLPYTMTEGGRDADALLELSSRIPIEWLSSGSFEELECIDGDSSARSRAFNELDNGSLIRVLDSADDGGHGGVVDTTWAAPTSDVEQLTQNFLLHHDDAQQLEHQQRVGMASTVSAMGSGSLSASSNTYGAMASTCTMQIQGCATEVSSACPGSVISRLTSSSSDVAGVAVSSIGRCSSSAAQAYVCILTDGGLEGNMSDVHRVWTKHGPVPVLSQRFVDSGASPRALLDHLDSSTGMVAELDISGSDATPAVESSALEAVASPVTDSTNCNSRGNGSPMFGYAMVRDDASAGQFFFTDSSIAQTRPFDVLPHCSTANRPCIMNVFDMRVRQRMKHVTTSPTASLCKSSLAAAPTGMQANMDEMDLPLGSAVEGRRCSEKAVHDGAKGTSAAPAATAGRLQRLAAAVVRSAVCMATCAGAVAKPDTTEG